MAHSRLIVGLGNPGKKYEETRHNLGAMLLKAYAEKYHLTFKREKEFHGELAKGTILNQKVFLLFPETYMNLSGQAVIRCMDYYHILLTNLLVISDDVAIPFGTFRERSGGSAGGHKGLKNIEETLGTQEYARLRMGVGGSEREELSDYVLGRFTEGEGKQLPEIIERGIEMLDTWVQQKGTINGERRKESSL